MGAARCVAGSAGPLRRLQERADLCVPPAARASVFVDVSGEIIGTVPTADFTMPPGPSDPSVGPRSISSRILTLPRHDEIISGHGGSPCFYRREPTKVRETTDPADPEMPLRCSRLFRETRVG